MNPMHFLVVPPMPIGTQPVEALPKAPATALADHLVQRRNHRRILGRPVHRGLVQRRPRETHDPASLATGELVLSHQALHRCSLGCRRHNFRDRTSWIAAFSSASSAYIRFRRLFSASRSLTRLSSPTDMPAYLLFHW